MEAETVAPIPQDGAASPSAAANGDPSLAAPSIEKVFAMGKGAGEESSYSKNSEVQAFLVHQFALSHLSDALERVSLSGPGPIVVADLGCSSGPNTIDHVSFIVDKLTSIARAAPDAASQSSLLEFQAYFSDLPSTDFNNLFHLLSRDLQSGPNFFAAGVPGSFYGRLFCRSSVHVFFSASSVHWLSEIPDSVLAKESPAFNRGSLWISTSAPEVAKAFKEQSLADLKSFLHARAEELVSGGLLFFFFGGRVAESLDSDLRADGFSFMDSVWTDLIAEGVLTNEQMDSLNFPIYRRTKEEVAEAIRSVDSLFEVVTVKAQESGANVFDVWPDAGPNEMARKIMGAGKSMLGGLIESHIGKQASDIVWQRYEEKIRAGGSPIQFGSSSRHIVALLRK